MTSTILCALDGSNHADKALDFAVDMAVKHDARLILFHALLRNVESQELQRFAEIEGLAKVVQPEVQRLLQVDGRVEVGRAYTVQPIASRTLAEIGQHILDAAKHVAESAGVREVVLRMADGDPANRILDCAKR